MKKLFIKANNKKLLFIVLFVLFRIIHADSQTANFDWMINAGGILHDYSRSVAIGKSNSAYVTGEFQQQAIFDTTLISGANYGLFLAKYAESDGSLIWVQKAIPNHDVFSMCVVSDNDDNAYITGKFNDTLSIGDTIIKGPAGLYTLFIAKYNANGQFQWARSAYSDEEASGYHLAVNSLNEVYLVAWFQRTLSFPNGTTIDTTLTGYPFRHAVAIAKFNNSGALLYARKISGADCIHANCIHIDNADDYYISGIMYDNINLGDTILQNENGPNYIAKFNNNNQLLWSKQAFGADFTSICTDNDRNVYIGGQVGPNSIFENNQLQSHGNTDALILKYNSSGIFKWVKLAGGIGADVCKTICTDGFNEFYIGGNFSNVAHFNYDSVTSIGGKDMFIAKFDSLGDFFSVKSFGSLHNDDCSSIAFFNPKNLYITGTFIDTLFWDSDFIIGHGNEDAFLSVLNGSTLLQVKNNDLSPVIRYYPNPCQESISVELPKIEANSELVFLNIFGQEMYSQKIEKAENKKTIQIPISALPKGIYIIKVSGNNYSSSGKFLKL